MKRKNFKKTLTMVSALALSAQLILPTAIFAESESDAAGTVERPGMTARAEEKTFKDDCIFIGSSDTSEDTDKASVKCISFGMHGGREMKYGMPDGEPPEKPDDESNFGETPDREPPEKPDGESNFGEAPDREPPEKPDGESNFGEAPDREPPVKPDGESNFGEAPDREPPEKPGDETFKETTIEISKGDTISIATSDGTVLETVTADKDAKGVVFSSDALVQNETYTLFINGEAAATAKLLERMSGENGIAGKGDKNPAEFQKPFEQNLHRRAAL